MRWVTKNDIADLTGSSWRTVKKRLDEAKLAPNENDCYDSTIALVAVLQPGASSGDNLSIQRARLAQAQAEKYEMENALKRGEQCLVADAEHAWTEQVMIVRSSLLSMPSGLAPILENRSAAEVEQILKDSIHDALRNFALRGNAVADGNDENLEAMESSAETHA